MRQAAQLVRRVVAVAGLAAAAALLPTFGQGATNISTIDISQDNAAIQICGANCVQVLQQFNIAIVSVNQGGLDYVGAAYLSAGAFDFGGTVHQQVHDFTLTNTSAAQPLIVPPGAIGMSGADPGDFTPVSNCPIVLVPGSRCVIRVTFAPAAVGPRSAVLAVRDSAIDSPEKIELAGTGVAATVTPAALDFGSAGIGAPVVRSVTIQNPGLDPLAVPSPGLAGPAAGDFAAAGCSVVAARSSCDLRVTFTAGDAGARQATLALTPTGLGGPFSIALAGTGVPLSLGPASLDFGSVLVGTSSAPRQVTLGNGGRSPVVISSVGLDGPAAAAFAGAAPCAGAGQEIAAGATCALPITFTPTAAGGASATLTIRYAAGGATFSATSALSGAGVAPGFGLAPAALSFGSVARGTSLARALSVSNPGTAPTTISSLALVGAGAGDYSLAGCGTPPVQIAPGASCVLTVTFTPSTAGDRPATLRVADSAAGSPHLVSIAGAGSVTASPPSPPANPPITSNPAGGANAAAAGGSVLGAGQPGLPNTGAAAGPQVPCLVGFVSPTVGRVELVWLTLLGLLLLVGAGMAARRRRHRGAG